MRLEIALLLLAGIKPRVVAKLLNANLHTVYYYNRALNTARKKLAKVGW